MPHAIFTRPTHFQLAHAQTNFPAVHVPRVDIIRVNHARQHARLQQNGGKISCCLSQNGGDGGEHRARKRRRNPTNIR